MDFLDTYKGNLAVSSMTGTRDLERRNFSFSFTVTIFTSSIYGL